MPYSTVKLDEPTSPVPIACDSSLKFLIPSLIGALVFLVPFKVGDTINIGTSLMADSSQTLLASALPPIAMVVLCLPVVAILYAKLTHLARAKNFMQSGDNNEN